MPLYMFATEAPSPRLKAEVASRLSEFLEGNPAATAAHIVTGMYYWERRQLPASYFAGEPAAAFIQRQAAALATPVLFVRTSQWRANRASIVDWANAQWASLALPGEPPAGIGYQNHWVRRAYKRLLASYSRIPTVTLTPHHQWRHAEIYRHPAAIPLLNI